MEAIKVPRKVINQAVKRKLAQVSKRDETIRILKQKLAGDHLANQLKRTNIELNKLKAAHAKLLKRRSSHEKDNEKEIIIQNEFKKLKSKITEQNNVIKDLQNQNMALEEIITDLQNGLTSTKADGKTYSSNTRIKVFDCIVNHVPTANIPVLLKQFSKWEGHSSDQVPSRSAVEMMSRKLGSISVYRQQKHY